MAKHIFIKLLREAKYLLCLFSYFLFCSKALASNWEVEVAQSRLSGRDNTIYEAVWREKGFVNETQIRIGCRLSAPIPSMLLRLPALSTDVLMPQNKAIVLVTDEPDSKKKFETGIVLSVSVQAGDIVMIPTGNKEQALKLEEVYRLLLAKAKKGEEDIAFIFVQNRHQYRINLKLNFFISSYQAMRDSCNALRLD